MSNEHREQSRHKRLGPEDYTRIQESLDSLDCDWNITDEQAEAVLREFGTSGKEIANQFIDRLLRERQEAIDALSSRDTEIREVLEGLMRTFSNERCWCGEGDYVHNDQDKACLAARALYAKLQPLQSENPGDTKAPKAARAEQSPDLQDSGTRDPLR